jgi:hypothetical protein
METDMKSRFKTIETFKLKVDVQQRDIDGGKCMLVSKCMHKVAIERALRNVDAKGGDHHVRCDGSDIKFNLDGSRWHAIMPKTGKTALLQFDKERKARDKAARLGLPFVSKVKPHKYVIECMKKGKIQPMTRDRQEQINAARRRRIAEGMPENRRYDLRYRIEGLGAV